MSKILYPERTETIIEFIDRLICEQRALGTPQVGIYDKIVFYVNRDTTKNDLINKYCDLCMNVRKYFEVLVRVDYGARSAVKSYVINATDEWAAIGDILTLVANSELGRGNIISIMPIN